MNTRTHQQLLAAALALLVLGCSEPTQPSDGSISSLPGVSEAVVANQILNLGFSQFVPCANGGAGEMVAGTGQFHRLVTSTQDAAGGSHRTVFHLNALNFSAEGAVTGDVYRLAGVSRRQENTIQGAPPLEGTLINKVRLIGPGPDNNLLISWTIHITINANGDVSSDVANTSVMCL